MPYYHFQLEVPILPEAVMSRLRTVVDDRPGFWLGPPLVFETKDSEMPPFTGWVRNNSFRFRMRGNIFRRDSFQPIIKGNVTSNNDTSRLSITMFIHPFVGLFVTVWLGVVGYGAIFDRSSSPIPLWLMFIFGLGLTIGIFAQEVGKAKELIVETLTRTS
jgi:hypothetical protein